MSTTRKAVAGSPLAQERYMSSVELAEKEGLKGMPVAAKASLYPDPRKRSLLFFLRALSSRPSGLEKVASELLDMFPDRIGCPTMHALGTKPGRLCDAAAVRAIRNELRLSHRHYPLRGEQGDFGDVNLDAEELKEFSRGLFLHCYRSSHESRANEAKPTIDTAKGIAQSHPSTYPMSAFLDYCHETAREHLAAFLWEFCLNPAVVLAVPGESVSAKSPNPGTMTRKHALWNWDLETASLRYFRDITGALLEYKARHEKAARAAIAETSISKKAFRTLERGLRSRRIVVIEGVEGVGKSFAGEAWWQCHLGQAVYVRLEGIVTRTTFFQAISSALGLASSVSQKSQEMQIRIRHHLELSGLMLIIDEAHRLFGQTERIYSHPELLNWVYTCWDQNIPVALLVTPQFVSRMDEVERQTDWRSGQFKRRVEDWKVLPEILSESDLRAVADKIAPGYTQAMREELVDFALPSRRQIDAMRRAISAAEFIADENGRKAPTHRDLLAGIEEAQATDQAMTTPLDKKRQTNAPISTLRGRPRKGHAAPAHEGCSEAATEAGIAREIEFIREASPAIAEGPRRSAGALV